MVNQKVNVLYMVTWISSLLLVFAAVGMGYSLYRMGSRPAPEIIAGVNGYALVGALVFVTVASAITLGVYSIVHTHRMLGSAYHIGLHLNRLNSGERNLNAITLRDGDYFREIAEEINRIQSKLVSPSAPAAVAPEAPASSPPAPPAT